MPNRIIKESLCESEKIASLTDFEFRLWIGLITQADDAGRGDARPAIIKGRVFPFRERVSIKDIDVAIQALAAKGCVSLYKVGGKPYFWFPGWSKHQRIRDCKPKYPAPPDPDSASSCDELQSSAATCGELPQTAADCGLNPNPNTNPNPNPSIISAEPQSASTLLEPPVFALPLNDGSEFAITQEQFQEWAELYPSVDVMQQLRSMKGWLESNPERRKTKRGIKRFATNWLSRHQDRGGVSALKTANKQTQCIDLGYDGGYV